MFRIRSFIFLLLINVSCYCLTIKSPSGIITADFDIIDKTPKWNMSYDGKSYISYSSLGLAVLPEKLGALKAISSKQTTVKETVKTTWGKFKSYDNNYTDLIWELQEEQGLGRKIIINARLYDSAVAIRYQLPAGGNWPEKTATGDSTEFCFADDYTGYSYRPERSPLGPQSLSKTEKCLLPMTIDCQDAYICVLETAIFNESPLSLERIEGKSNSFIGRFEKSIITAGTYTSWRTVLIGKNAGDLLTSPAVYCLNPANKIKNDDWIKPGLAFWDWRAWGAKTEDGFTYGLDMESWERFIDFASKNNIRYLVIDAGWYGQEFDKTSDPRTSRDYLLIQPNPNKPNLEKVAAPANWEKPIDIPQLIKYAKERNVGIILYFNDIARFNFPFEETLSLYHQWGAAGIKYGFMAAKGQQKVLDTRRIVEMCAKYEMLCNFHDNPIPPSGDCRTWPNYITREFCHSQSDALRAFSPRDFCEQIFVNMVAGEMDMCNGLYTLANPAADRPKIFQNIDTTIVAETARVLITDSGLSILPDCPEAYQAKADLFDFLTKLPMTWDETKILNSNIGQYITTARKAEGKWYIASATNEEARTLKIDLSFLKKDQPYLATLYEDAAEADCKTNREAYVIRQQQVKYGDVITAKLAPGGGHCIYIEMK